MICAHSPIPRGSQAAEQARLRPVAPAARRAVHAPAAPRAPMTELLCPAPSRTRTPSPAARSASPFRPARLQPLVLAVGAELHTGAPLVVGASLSPARLSPRLPHMPSQFERTQQQQARTASDRAAHRPDPIYQAVAVPQPFSAKPPAPAAPSEISRRLLEGIGTTRPATHRSASSAIQHASASTSSAVDGDEAVVHDGADVQHVPGTETEALSTEASSDVPHETPPVCDDGGEQDEQDEQDVGTEQPGVQTNSSGSPSLCCRVVRRTSR